MVTKKLLSYETSPQPRVALLDYSLDNGRDTRNMAREVKAAASFLHTISNMP